MEEILTHGSLFAGIGGFDLGFERAGIKTLWQVEIDGWCRRLLAQRFPGAQQYGDINQCFPELTSSAAGFPARTSPTLASAPELPEAVLDSGGQWCVPFAWYDRATQLWRTWQRCLGGEWTEFLETWPRAGMTRNGIAYQRQPLVPRTSATEHFLWPTPVLNSLNNRPGMGPKSGWGLQAAVRTWPTPTATERENDTTATPSENSLRRYRDGEIKRVRKTRAPTLTSAVKMWPTPSAADSKRAGNFGRGEGNPTLAGAVKMVPTPTARDYRSPGTPERLERAKKESSRGQPLTETVGGQLNPTWVEWLMGFPLEWTALEDSETPLSRKSRSGSPEEL